MSFVPKNKYKSVLLHRQWVYALAILLIFCMPYHKTSMTELGFILFAITIDSLVLFRKSGRIFILLLLLSIANFSLIYGCFWFYKENYYYWQDTLIDTEAQYVTAQALVIWYIAILIGIYKGFDTKKYYTIETLRDEKFKVYQLAPVFFWIGYFFLLYILIFCFDRSVDSYTSGNSPLYEYSVLIYFCIWQYKPKEAIYKWFLLLFSFLYILQGLIFGDRSSAVPMLLLLYILIMPHIRTYLLWIFSFGGILGANIIGIYRRTFSIERHLFDIVVSRALYVDSIAYSFYAGIQIIRASTISAYEKMETFKEWLISLFLGSGGGRSQYNVVKYIMTISGDYFNRGGGMSSSYFYFWFGFLGDLISGLLMGFIIGKIFSKSTTFYPLMQLAIIVFALRWYVYFPNVFFRTCLIVPFLMYYFIRISSKYFRISQ